MSTSRVGAVA